MPKATRCPSATNVSADGGVAKAQQRIDDVPGRPVTCQSAGLVVVSGTSTQEDGPAWRMALIRSRC